MKQLVSKQTRFVNEEKKVLRECRGRRCALLGKVLRLENSEHTFYVKSESKDIFYFVEYKTDSQFCTCWDYASNRSDKCKHIFAIEYALRLNLVQQIDHKLPISQKTSDGIPSESLIKPKSIADQYKNLSIATLNEIEKAEIEAEKYNSSKTQRVQRWEDDTYDF